MEQITALQIFWLIIGTAATSGAITILSALVTGYLVFRSKRESHETLIPVQREKRKGPLVIDEFATETMRDSDEGLPDVVMRMNERLGAELALSGLKGRSE